MAKVHAQVVGGEIKEVSMSTVGDVKKYMNADKYTATVNGDPANNDQRLTDFDFVSLAPAVKGA